MVLFLVLDDAIFCLFAYNIHTRIPSCVRMQIECVMQLRLCFFAAATAKARTLTNTYQYYGGP